MSAPDRRAMLDRADRTLSLRRQCALLGVARSGVYRPRKPANDNDADALDRRTVHCLALSRFAPDDGDAARGGRVCEPEARPAADASDGDRGARAEAENEQARARPQDLSLSPAQSDDRAREPRLGCRHHLYSDRARLSLSRGDHRLGIRARCLRGGCRTRWTFRSVWWRSRRRWRSSPSRRFSIPTKARCSLRPPSPARSPKRASRSPWTAEAAGWTTCVPPLQGQNVRTRHRQMRAA